MTHATRLAACLAAALLAAPLAAEEAPDDIGRGTDLMQEGAKLLLRGMIAQMGPALSQMEEFAKLIGEWDQYHAPEVLPNGDIILRRKVPLIPGLPGDAAPEGDIDL